MKATTRLYGKHLSPDTIIKQKEVATDKKQAATHMLRDLYEIPLMQRDDKLEMDLISAVKFNDNLLNEEL